MYVCDASNIIIYKGMTQLPEMSNLVADPLLCGIEVITEGLLLKKHCTKGRHKRLLIVALTTQKEQTRTKQ